MAIRLRVWIAAIAVIAASLVTGATPAQAVTVNYYLPYTAGFTAVMTQGPGGSTSHTGTNAHAYDFDLNGGAVRASAPGTIVGKVANQTSQTGPGNSGNYVVIKHADNTCTSYAHMAYGSVTTKSVGDSVAQAEHIGNEGNTGYTLPVGGGHHLHFQRDNCSWNSIPVDFVENNWTSQNEAAPVPGGSSVVFANGGGETWANTSPTSNAWTKLSNTTNALSVSGNYTAWIDGCGAAWATSNFANVAATQITACNGATAIAIGSQGNLVFVDSCGSAHASNTYTNSQSWVILTGCGGTTAVAAGGGGTGRVGVINGCGALNVTVNYQNWTQIAGCGGAQKVAIGPNGTLAFTNGCGALNATTDYTNPAAWVPITGCGGATQFAVGTDKRLVFADGCGSAHGTMTYDSPSSWVVLNECGDAQAIAMGTGGQTGIINGCGALNVTSNFQSWLPIAPCGGATRVAIS